jgi:hypothetical protein
LLDFFGVCFSSCLLSLETSHAQSNIKCFELTCRQLSAASLQCSKLMFANPISAPDRWSGSHPLSRLHRICCRPVYSICAWLALISSPWKFTAGLIFSAHRHAQGPLSRQFAGGVDICRHNGSAPLHLPVTSVGNVGDPDSLVLQSLSDEGRTVQPGNTAGGMQFESALLRSSHAVTPGIIIGRHRRRRTRPTPGVLPR